MLLKGKINLENIVGGSKRFKKEPKEDAIIHFFEDKNKRIIGRMPSGKIAIIDRNYKDGSINDNEDWSISIVSEEEKKVIVRPLKLIITAEENRALLNKMADKLRKKDWNFAAGKSHKPGENIERNDEISYTR